MCALAEYIGVDTFKQICSSHTIREKTRVNLTTCVTLQNPSARNIRHSWLVSVSLWRVWVKNQIPPLNQPRTSDPHSSVIDQVTTSISGHFLIIIRLCHFDCSLNSESQPTEMFSFQLFLPCGLVRKCPVARECVLRQL